MLLEPLIAQRTVLRENITAISQPAKLARIRSGPSRLNTASTATDIGLPTSIKSIANDNSNMICTSSNNSNINCNIANNSSRIYEQLDTAYSEPNTTYDSLTNSKNVSKTSSKYSEPIATNDEYLELTAINDEYLEPIATNNEYLDVYETLPKQVHIDALAATSSRRTLPQTTTDTQQPTCSINTPRPAILHPPSDKQRRKPSLPQRLDTSRYADSDQNSALDSRHQHGAVLHNTVTIWFSRSR
jgi:hypothetical protein